MRAGAGRAGFFQGRTRGTAPRRGVVAATAAALVVGAALAPPAVATHQPLPTWTLSAVECGMGIPGITVGIDNDLEVTTYIEVLLDGDTVFAIALPTDASLGRTHDDLPAYGLIHLDHGARYTIDIKNAHGEALDYVTGTAPLCWEETRFSDVPDDHAFAGPIAWASIFGVGQGYPDGTFRPTAPVTRQAAAAFLERTVGPSFTPPAVAAFSDVPTSHPFYAEISWLDAEGIATGYPDGTFRPGAVVTRQAVAAFLHRLEGAPLTPVPATPIFSDVPSDHPFAAEITWVAQSELATGYDDGTFRPGAVVSRQAMVAFLHRWWMAEVRERAWG